MVPGSRITARAIRWLERPRATLWIVVIALLLVLPCVTVGFAADDHVLRTQLIDELSVPGFERHPLDAFTFATGEAASNEGLRETGTFSWWVAPDLRLDFWRPVSALTHWIDFRLWPETPSAMYVHSIAWFLALLAILARLYRRLQGPWVGALALALYAFDDARGPTIGWISNRNALVMATFAAGALLAHDAWRRRQWRPGSVLSVVLLAAALLSAEGAVAVFGYLLAHAAFVERGAWVRRLSGLLPAFTVGASWALTYRWLGRGARGSGVYLDPLATPVEFWQHAPTRIVVLLQAQLGGPWADFWPVYPPDVAAAVLGAGVVGGVVIAVLLWPLRRDRVARMWLVGMVLSCVPVAGTFPADRLLTLVGVGAMGLLALGLAQLAGTDIGRWRRAGLVALGGLHLVVAPLLLPIRVRSMQSVQRTTRMFDAGVPDDASIRDRTVVVVSAPNDGLVSYLPFLRASQRRPAPQKLRLLTTSFAPVLIERLDERTLRLRPGDGFLPDMAHQMLRGPQRPFTAGEVIELQDMTVEVTAITPDGRPAVATFVFDSLEDDQLVWRTYRNGAFVPWEPPPVGESVELPAVDVERLAKIVLEG